MNDIAKKLNLTERTIYREMSDIKDTLSSLDIQLESVHGKGMKLSGPEEKINQLKIILQKSTNTFEFDPIARRDLLLVELLHHEDYLKSQALAIDLDVSIQTIRNDLRKIEKTLKVHNLKLVTKRSEGVIIKGNKLIKNHLLNSLMVRNIDIDVFFDWLNNGKEHANTFIQMLEKYNYRDTLLEISEIVRKLIVEENIKSNDTNFKEFIILLSRIILYGCSEVEYQEFNQAITYKDINNSKILKLEQQLTKQFNKTFNKEELKIENSEIVRKLIVEENIKSNDTNFKEFIILLSRIILYGCSEVEYQEFNQAITYKDINNSKILKLEQQLTKQFNKTFNKEELIYVNWLIDRKSTR